MSPPGEGWAQLGTAEVSDALDRLGLHGAALGIVPQAGTPRLLGRAFTLGGTVSLADVRVEAGDLLLGDEDGIVVVPVAREQEVLERALEVAEAEARIGDLLRGGKTLREAREQERYHRLQRREP